MDYMLKEANERNSEQALYKLGIAYIINFLKHCPT